MFEKVDLSFFEKGLMVASVVAQAVVVVVWLVELGLR